MSTVIQIENLSKTYRLGVIGGGTLRADVARWMARLAGKPDPALKIGQESQARLVGQEFKALKDVSFEVKRGDILGVIGRNGAGKSTLLKILSRVTAPTAGEVRIKGRIASLLEVGTGFHPELTGRENVFLNGAILGMAKAEIKRKFDEIVAFSGVEDFIDTPVKRYSSGMYVRLAFAVAAHLEPEILIVDEVLAVGDSDFQKKCLGKMQDVSKEGRTILFVSHNMAAIGKLCNVCLLMNGGKVSLQGPTADVVPHYLKIGEQSNGIRLWDPSVPNTLDERLRLHSLRILAPDGSVTGHIDIRREFAIEINYSILQQIPRFRMCLRFITSDGVIAFSTADSAMDTYETKKTSPGVYTSRCIVPGNLLNEGFYSLHLTADVPFQKTLVDEEGAIGFSVEQTGGVNSRFQEKWPGTVCPHLDWLTLAN